MNRTDAEAAILRTTSGERRLLAAVVVRPTFRIEPGRLAPAPEFRWPVGPAPLQTPVGEFPGDQPFLNGGVDVLVMGTARAEPPRERVDVSVRIGPSFERHMAVFGDRRWVREDGALIPSRPEPFQEMPLTYDRAYGGSARTEHGSLAWAPNPHGRGFYLSEEEAEGQPLPNLEDPNELIRTFEDRPRVVGSAPYPSDGSLAKLNAVDFQCDPDDPARSQLREVKPTLFNVAHPDWIIPAAESPRPGDRVVIQGMDPNGAFDFSLPDQRYFVHVQLERRSFLFPLHLDQIGVLLDHRRVFLSYRVAFRYRLVKFERRRATLHAGPVPDAVPEDSLMDLDAMDAPLRPGGVC